MVAFQFVRNKLIILVMSLITEEMATTYLACLSPYELKCFVELILKGDELNKTQDICEFTRRYIIIHHKS